MVKNDRILIFLTFAFACALPQVSVAAGSGALDNVSSLMNTVVTWAQRIGVVFAIGAVVRAGIYKALNDHHADEKLKSAALGSVLILGAAGFVEFIKGFFPV